MNCRAWSIIRKDGINYLIKEFYHKSGTVGLAEWVYPVDKIFIANLADRLPVCCEIKIEDLDSYDLIFSW